MTQEPVASDADASQLHQVAASVPAAAPKPLQSASFRCGIALLQARTTSSIKQSRGSPALVVLASNNYADDTLSDISMTSEELPRVLEVSRFATARQNEVMYLCIRLQI